MNGIYLIRNNANGLVYVGSTKRDIEQRWKEHVMCLNGGYHQNKHLQKDWNEFGQSSFEFEIVSAGYVNRQKETETILAYAPNCYNMITPTTIVNKVSSFSSIFKFKRPIKNRKNN